MLLANDVCETDRPCERWDATPLGVRNEVNSVVSTTRPALYPRASSRIALSRQNLALSAHVGEGSMDARRAEIDAEDVDLGL